MVELFVFLFTVVTAIGWYVTMHITGLKISILILSLWLIFCMIVVNCISSEPTPKELHIYNQGRKGVGYR